jgi:hypothetical protein
MMGPSTTEESLWHMHCKYGASLKDLFLFVNAQTEYDKLVESELATLSFEDVYHLLRGIIVPSENSHLLVSIGPSEGDRDFAERKFTSRYIMERVCERVFEAGAGVGEITRLCETLRIQ